MSHLSDLANHGQSFWLDNLSRAMLKDGSLARRVEQQGLTGVTSNPAIFHRAISDSSLYDEPLIGPYTVSTMPGQTADAFADHGRVEPTVERGVEEARAAMEGLEQLGIDFGAVTEGLVSEGVQDRVIDAYSVEPLDVKTLERAARETGTLLVVEDHHIYGGLGDAVSGQIGRLARVLRMGISGEPHSGTPAELFKRHHISAESVAQEAVAVAA